MGQSSNCFGHSEETAMPGCLSSNFFLQVQVKMKGPGVSPVCASEGKGCVEAEEGSGLGSSW